MPYKIMNSAGKTAIYIASCIIFFTHTTSWATGPRVTQSLISPNKNQIYAVDFPPYVTTDIESGGMNFEIINAALSARKIDSLQTSLPLPKMVKYYLSQENALAVHDRYIHFTNEDSKTLLSIPFSVSEEYYYKHIDSKHIKWNGEFSSFNKLSYGTYKGDNVAELKKAGVKVKFGKPKSLLKKLYAKKIDVIKLPSLNASWFIDHKFQDKKQKIVRLKRPASITPLFISFNLNHQKGKSYAASFNNELDKMINDGRYEHILKQYIKNKSRRYKFIAKLKTYRKKF